MGEPKFQIGQRVAAFVMHDGRIVACHTDTVIADIVPPGTRMRNLLNGETVRTSGWMYELEAERGACYGERQLRPLYDDDYTDTTEEELERTA